MSFKVILETILKVSCLSNPFITYGLPGYWLPGTGGIQTLTRRQGRFGFLNTGE